MNYLAWLGLVTNLASIVAQQKGVAPKELGYLSVLTNAAALTALTDKDLSDLKAKYEAEVAAGTDTSSEELEAIIQRIQARGAAIQGA